MGAYQGLAVVATLPILMLLLAHAPSAHDLDGSVYCSRDGETRRLSGFGAVAPVWSPDGERICYVQHTHDENLFHFDRQRPGQGYGLQQLSGRRNEIVGFQAFVVGDFDEPATHGRSGNNAREYYMIGHNEGRFRDHSVMMDGILIPANGIDSDDSAIKPDSWARIKASFLP